MSSFIYLEALKIAAGILPFCINTKRFLICLRSSEVSHPNVYSTWGGSLKRGENIEQGALRELKEETKFSGSMNLIKTFLYIKKDFIYHNFIGETESEFHPVINWESADYEWLSYDKLLKKRNLHPGLRALIRSSEFIKYTEEKGI